MMRDGRIPINVATSRAIIEAMSIKSTRELTRPDALALFEEFTVKLGRGQRMSDAELGDALDELDEMVCKLEGRVCFTNYMVVPE